MSRAGVAHRFTVADRHPLLLVVGMGLVLMPLQMWWFARYRPLGSLNADEAGYLATGLRYHRNMVEGGLSALVARIGESTSGPLVPLLGLPLVAVAGRSVVALQVVQPLLHVAGATAVAGIGLRLASARHAVICGFVVLCMPVALIAARSYQLAPAAAAACASAAWALLASDRGRRTGPMAAFGLAVGCMLLARTMSVAYLPSLAVAAVIVLDSTRAAWRNLCLAAAVALLTAGPWWISAWDGITGYLVRFGYGDRARSYAGGPLWARPILGLGEIGGSLLMPAWTLAAIAVLGAVVYRLATDRDLRVRRALVEQRDLAAIAAAVVVGWVVLLSSANDGTWFELPLLYLAVPVVVRSADVLAPRQRAAAALAVVVIGLAHLVVVGNVATVRAITSDPYRPDNDLVLSDERLGEPSERPRAASQWWAAHHEIASTIDRLTGDGQALVTVGGSGHLLGTNSLQLVQELSGHGATGFEELATDAPDLAGRLQQADADTQRVLVVIEATSEPFPGSSDPQRLLRAAAAAGWDRRAAVRLPDGGSATILTPPTPHAR